MFFDSKFTVIDIGTDSIKAVKFKKKGKNLAALDLGLQSLPYDSIKEGRIIDETVVANRLMELIRELNCKNSKIITTIPNNNLIIRNMELPDMKDESQLAEAIKWESEDHLPFPVESAVEDFRILSREDGNVQVLLVATKRDMIDNFMNIFERISITPRVMNIQPMALVSLAEYQNKIENTVAIVDIGMSGTRVVIGDNKNIYLSRTIDIGGYEFTRIIMEEDKLSYSEAEQLKKEKGIQEEFDDEETEFDISQIAATGMGERQYMISMARNLAEQIGRSLDYYNMKYRKKVDQIFITGGGAKLKGLKGIIEKQIERDLYSLDPFLNISSRQAGILNSDEFAVAIGLGVSEVLA